MIKRAWIYLVRRYKRSALLLLLLFVVSFSISVGMSVWNSINAVTKDIEESLGTSITLKLSRSTIQNEMYRLNLIDREGNKTFTYGGPPLTDDVIQQILKEVKGISYYNADTNEYCHLDGLKLFPGFWTYTRDKYQKNPDLVVNKPGDKEKRIMYAQCTFAFGNTDSSLDNRFRTGSFELVEGRHLISEKDYDKVLISDELATLNGLKLGDTIDISVRAGFLGSTETLKRWGETIKLEIIGIFHVNGYQPISDWITEDEITYNHIFTDIATVKELYRVGFSTDLENLPELRYNNVTFFVDNPVQLPDVLEQMQNLECIDTQYYDIAIDDTMYKSTVDPLNSIRNLVVGLVLAIVLGCTVVLCIVFTMWVRSRRQEIAVYLSMGISKAAILGQFVLEAGLVALLAGVLSFAVCQQVPDLIGNQMLASTIEAAQPEVKEPTREEIHQAAQSGTVNELFTYESSAYAGPDHIDFTFRAADFAILLLLELLLITAAICKAGWFIFELQPRQIMTTLR